MAERALATAFVNIVPGTKEMESYLKGGLQSGMAGAGTMGGAAFGNGFLGKAKAFMGPIASVFAVGAIGRFTMDLVKAGEEEVKGNARLQQIATSMNLFGGATDSVVDRLKNYANTQQMNLGVDDDVIKLTQAKLLTFKELAKSADTAGGAFDRATMAAMDMAAAGFGTAEGNAVQLGKALQDPIKGITALNKSGITFTATEKERIKTLVESNKIGEAQNLVLQAIETQVGGTAAATATSSEKMKQAFSRLKESIGLTLLPAFDSLVEKAIPAIESISNAFETLPDRIGDAGGLTNFISNMVNSAVSWIQNGGIQSLIASFSSLRSSIISTIAQDAPAVISQIATALIGALPSIVQTLMAMYPQMLQTALTLFKSLQDAIVVIVPQLITAITDALPQIISAIISMLPEVILAAVNLFTGLIQGLTTALPAIITAVVGAIPKIITAIVDAIPLIIDAAAELFTGLVDGLTKAMPQIIDAVVKLIPVIVKALADATPKLIQAGIDILTGLAKGIIDNAPRIIGAAIKGVADLVTNTLKTLLGIKSPSKVFHGYGEDIGEGLVDGIDSMKSAVEKSAYELGSYANKGFTMSLKELTEAGNYGTLAGTKFFKATSSSDIASYLSQGGVLDVNGVTMADLKAAISSDAAGNEKLAKAAKKSGQGYYANPALMALLEKAGYTFKNGYSVQEEGMLLQELTNRLQGGFTSYSTNSKGQVIQTGSSPIMELTSEALNSTFSPLIAGTKFDAISKASIETFIAKQQATLAEAAAWGGSNSVLSPEYLATVQADLAKAQKLIAPAVKAAAKAPKKIPKLAAGGFVNDPTMAIIGEAGPEVVTPLKDFERMMGMGNSASGQQKVLNYYAAPNESIDREEALFKAMRRAKLVSAW